MTFLRASSEEELDTDKDKEEETETQKLTTELTSTTNKIQKENTRFDGRASVEAWS